MKRKIRVLLAKPGLDGHDKGAKIVALALRDAGMEVIYTGLHQNVEQIFKAALEEGVDLIGLSILSGAHLPVCRRLTELLRSEGLYDVRIAVGGVIPKKDAAALEAMGVDGIFPGGTPLKEIVVGIEALFPERAVG
jgi:methylmalonyl-CoA mutase C-terminal domain/subunit